MFLGAILASFKKNKFFGLILNVKSSMLPKMFSCLRVFNLSFRGQFFQWEPK